MIEVELFNGTVLEFPDGTSQDVISRVAKEQTANIQGNQVQRSGIGEVGKDLAKSTWHGLKTAYHGLGQTGVDVLDAIGVDSVMGADLDDLRDTLGNRVDWNRAKVAEMDKTSPNIDFDVHLPFLGKTNVDISAADVGQFVGESAPAAIATAALPAGAAGAKVAGRSTATLLDSALTGAKLGAIGGGVGGATQAVGEGEEAHRVFDTIAGTIGGGVTGGALAPAAVYAGRKGGALVNKATKFGRDKLGIPAKKAASVLPDDIPLTAGQRTQDAATQSFETSALAGSKGERAQELMTKFRGVQQGVLRNKFDAMQKRAGGVLSEFGDVDETDVIEAGIRGIRTEARALDEKVTKAYEAARSHDTAIPSKFIGERLNKRVKNVVSDGGFDLRGDGMGDARRLIDDLGEIQGKMKGGRISAVKLQAMENWRKRVTNAANDARGTSAGNLLSKVRREYDEFMDDVITEGVAQGSEAGIKVFKNARDLRRLYGRRFEPNAVIESIVKGVDRSGTPITTETAVNNIIGAGALSGKRQAGQIVADLKRAAGDSAPEFSDAIKQGLLHRVFRRSLEAQRLDGEMPAISFAKLNTELKSLMKNKSLMNEAFDAVDISGIREMQQAVNKIASRQEGSINPSNTYEKLATSFKQTPLVGDFFRVLTDYPNAKQAQESIGYFFAKNDKQMKLPMRYMMGAITEDPENQPLRGAIDAPAQRKKTVLNNGG